MPSPRRHRAPAGGSAAAIAARSRLPWRRWWPISPRAQGELRATARARPPRARARGGRFAASSSRWPCETRRRSRTSWPRLGADARTQAAALTRRPPSRYELLERAVSVGDLAATMADVGVRSALGDAATARFSRGRRGRSAYWAMRADLDADARRKHARCCRRALELVEKVGSGGVAGAADPGRADPLSCPRAR